MKHGFRPRLGNPARSSRLTPILPNLMFRNGDTWWVNRKTLARLIAMSGSKNKDCVTNSFLAGMHIRCPGHPPSRRMIRREAWKLKQKARVK